MCYCNLIQSGTDSKHMYHFIESPSTTSHDYQRLWNSVQIGPVVLNCLHEWFSLIFLCVAVGISIWLEIYWYVFRFSIAIHCRRKRKSTCGSVPWLLMLRHLPSPGHQQSVVLTRCRIKDKHAIVFHQEIFQLSAPCQYRQMQKNATLFMLSNISTYKVRNIDAPTRWWDSSLIYGLRKSSAL